MKNDEHYSFSLPRCPITQKNVLYCDNCIFLYESEKETECELKAIIDYHYQQIKSKT